MDVNSEILRLSDLVRLCGTTMRLLARERCSDGAASAGDDLAADLERIAMDMRRLSRSEFELGADPTS